MSLQLPNISWKNVSLEEIPWLRQSLFQARLSLTSVCRPASGALRGASRLGHSAVSVRNAECVVQLALAGMSATTFSIFSAKTAPSLTTPDIESTPSSIAHSPSSTMAAAAARVPCLVAVEAALPSVVGTMLRSRVDGYSLPSGIVGFTLEYMLSSAAQDATAGEMAAVIATSKRVTSPGATRFSSSKALQHSEVVSATTPFSS